MVESSRGGRGEVAGGRQPGGGDGKEENGRRATRRLTSGSVGMVASGRRGGRVEQELVEDEEGRGRRRRRADAVRCESCRAGRIGAGAARPDAMQVLAGLAEERRVRSAGREEGPARGRGRRAVLEQRR